MIAFMSFFILSSSDLMAISRDPGYSKDPRAVMSQNSRRGSVIRRSGYTDGMSLYLGLKNSPMKYVDPTGMTTEVTVSVSVHGSRYGGDGAFDGRAKTSGGGKYDAVDTGKALLDLLVKKSEEDCCIKKLFIHSHSLGKSLSMRWDSGFYQKGKAGERKPVDPNPPANVGESHKQIKDASRNVADLKALIDAKKVKFCEGCVITLFGCWSGAKGNLAQALSSATPCTVKAPIGKCYPVNKAGKGVSDKSTDKNEVGGGSDKGFNEWKDGKATKQDGKSVPYK